MAYSRIYPHGAMPVGETETLERLDTQIHVMVTAEQKRMILDAAKICGLSTSRFARLAALRVAREPALLDPDSVPASNRGDLMAHLKMLVDEIVVSGNRPDDDVARLLRILADQIPRPGYTA